MPSLRPRGSSVFSGLLLIFIGLLFLLHNYRGFDLTSFFGRWSGLIKRDNTCPAWAISISRGVKRLPAASTWRLNLCRRTHALRCAGDEATLSFALRTRRRFACPAKST